MSRPKLLLADDSATIRKVVELTFTDEGIDVTAVGDSPSAMQAFVDLQPDIVLVDVSLAGTSGYQICEMIKADEATKDIPVLLLVGSFEPFDQDAAENAGADGFLTKPFQSIRDLVARVKDLLEDGNGTGAVDSPASSAENAEAADDILVDSDRSRGLAESVAPDTADIDNLYLNSFAETVEIDNYDTVDDLLDDAGLDDAMIEASHPEIDDSSETDAQEVAETPQEQVKEFDWSPAALVSEPAASDEHIEIEGSTAPAEMTEVSPFERVVDDEGAETTEMEAPVLEEQAMIDPAPVSSEMIDAIATKVLERLSDKVVREIALETVPRVAEKLIREALETGGRKS